MNKKHLLIPVLLGVTFSVSTLSSCCGGYGGYCGGYYPNYYEETKEDKYLEIEEIDYQSPIEAPTSSFSLDSSSAAYSNIRRDILEGYDIVQNQVIIEQMVNYFTYDYASPTEDPVALYTEMSNCPWNEEAYLASVAVKTKEIKSEDTAGNNYVFLIDVSGSMSSSTRLPYVKKGFTYLVDKLNDNDKVSLVTYSGREEVLLDGVKASNRNKIHNVLNNLYASGCTNGSSAIQKAYNLAKKHFIPGGTNQILLATDGDFNVGITSTDELEKMVKDHVEEGISLSTFGFGMGNYRDELMQTLALNGNGNVFYIDDEREVEKLFAGDISQILQVVAKDAKIQIEFDSEKVKKYRLIGYENRMMSEEDFNNEQKDAGEIYSNRTVVALYEIIPNGENNSGLYDITFRYKDNKTNEQSEIKTNGPEFTTTPSENHVFASLVAEFGLVLRESKYKGAATFDSIIELFKEYPNFKNDPERKEFIELVEKAKNINKKSYIQ